MFATAKRSADKESEPRIQPQVGAEARCMSYAIEAFWSRPQARFTKARRRCRNSLKKAPDITAESFHSLHEYICFQNLSFSEFAAPRPLNRERAALKL